MDLLNKKIHWRRLALKNVFSIRLYIISMCNTLASHVKMDLIEFQTRRTSTIYILIEKYDIFQDIQLCARDVRWMFLSMKSKIAFTCHRNLFNATTTGDSRVFNTLFNN